MVLFALNFTTLYEYREWLLPAAFIPLVPTALPTLDIYPHRSPLFVPIIPVQPSTTSEQATHRHGGDLVLFVHVQQDREPLHLQSVRRCFCHWCIYGWIIGKYLFEEDGRHCIHFNGDRRTVSRSCKSLIYLFLPLLSNHF